MEEIANAWPHLADVFVAYPTMPGYEACGGEDNGSLFQQADEYPMKERNIGYGVLNQPRNEDKLKKLIQKCNHRHTLLIIEIADLLNRMSKELRNLTLISRLSKGSELLEPGIQVYEQNDTGAFVG
jgi:hypothetical protein